MVWWAVSSYCFHLFRVRRGGGKRTRERGVEIRMSGIIDKGGVWVRLRAGGGGNSEPWTASCSGQSTSISLEQLLLLRWWGKKGRRRRRDKPRPSPPSHAQQITLALMQHHLLLVILLPLSFFPHKRTGQCGIHDSLLAPAPAKPPPPPPYTSSLPLYYDHGLGPPLATVTTMASS